MVEVLILLKGDVEAVGVGVAEAGRGQRFGFLVGEEGEDGQA
jgi:hypothetical protein